MAQQANAGRSAAMAELHQHTALLITTLILVVLSIVAIFAPGFGIIHGNMLGGGNQVTLELATSDGSELSEDDCTKAVSVLQARANSLYEHGVEVVALGDNKVGVRVPNSYDAETVANSLPGTGRVELVSQLDISDADELELLTSSNSSTDDSELTLSEGTYSAFITSDNITAAQVVISGSGASTVYAVQVTFDADGASAFAQETEELASSYGIIAVVLDGKVIATPYVSSKIEGNQVNISGNFTRDEAYAFAAKLNSDELPCTATVGASESFTDVCAGHAPKVAVLVLVLIAIAAGFGLKRLYGSVAWTATASLIATTIVGLGIMCIVARFDFVILGTWELAGGICVALASLAASAAAAYTYHAQRVSGLSVRKSQQVAASFMMLFEHCYLAVIVVALVATFFVSGGFAEFLWALASGLVAEVVLAYLFKQPALCVFSAPDVAGAEALGSDGAPSAKQAE